MLLRQLVNIAMTNTAKVVISLSPWSIAFHGRTITTLSATGQDVFHQHFFPFTEGFIHTPANDIDAALKVLANPAVCHHDGTYPR